MGQSLPQNTNIYLVIRTNCRERMRLFPYKIYFHPLKFAQFLPRKVSGLALSPAYMRHLAHRERWKRCMRWQIGQ